MPWSKNFDVDEALERAAETFWSKGYEATSMRELLQAMGIQKGSFYDTYGSKHEAFLGALDKYANQRYVEFQELAEGKSPRQAIEAMLDEIYRDSISESGSRGCMVINCALELAPHDPDAQEAVLRSFKGHEDLMAEWIRAGQEQGEISAELDAKSISKSMMALIMGLRVYSRAGAPKATLKTLIDQAAALIDS